MKVTIKFLIFLIFIFVIVGGCTSVEKNEGVGQEPYFRPERPAELAPPPQVGMRSYNPTALPESSGVIQSYSEMPEEDPTLISRFAKIYAEQGQPRIAFYLNRELSDNVRDWSGKAQVEVGDWESCGMFACSENQKKEGAVRIKGTSEKSAERKSPDEAWVWAFESGFLDSFLTAKAKLVDRATIIRLIDASNAKTSVELPLEKDNRIEMGGLLEYTDMFFEVLITRAPDSNYGYEFKAIAKETRTGIILAIASSTLWEDGMATSDQIITTEDGYQFYPSLPPVSEVSRRLALDLMDRLIQIWSA